jgi:hypothetical protein
LSVLFGTAASTRRTRQAPLLVVGKLGQGCGIMDAGQVVVGLRPSEVPADVGAALAPNL